MSYSYSNPTPEQGIPQQTAPLPVVTPPAVPSPIIDWACHIMFTDDSPFESIIGVAGTTEVPLSAQAMPWDPPFSIGLGFAFKFLGRQYTAATKLRVGIGGFIGFDNAVTDGSITYDVAFESSGRFSRLLMPYWSDLRGLDGGGIFHRVDDDPLTSGKHVLTIEWRVAGTFWPGGEAGNFQVKLFERDSTILFIYDTDRPIERSRPSQPGEHFGAAVGIKNQGQALPLLTGCRHGLLTGNDCGVLLFPNDEHTDLPPAINTLPVFEHGGSRTPEWYADYRLAIDDGDRVPSSLFHYTFPRHGYRIKPVEGNVEKMQTVVAPSLDPEMPELASLDRALGRPMLYPHLPPAGMHSGRIPIAITVRSFGANPTPSIGVQARIISETGITAYDVAIMAGPLTARGGRREVHFPDFTPSAPGTYRIIFTLHADEFDASSIFDSIDWSFDVV